MNTNSPWRIVLQSLKFFARSHCSVALGIAAATAVIVGALIVGDSVRGSLRATVLDRLGSVECLLHSRTFFEPQVLEALEFEPAGTQVSCQPAIILTGSTVERRQDDKTLRATKVQMVAGNTALWDSLFSRSELQSQIALGEDEVAVNASLAAELSLVIGDEITVRMSNTPGVPADNPLGRRDAIAASLPRQRVVAILPNESPGSIRFTSSQEVPLNVFCSQATVQDILECGTQVNAAFVFTDPSTNVPGSRGQDLCDQLNLQLRPSLEDFGLQLTRHRRVFPDPEIDVTSSLGQPPSAVFDYYQLSSTELVIDNATTHAVVQQLGLQETTRLISYVANSIQKVKPTQFDLSPQRSAIRYESRYVDRDDTERANRAGGNRVVGEEHQLATRDAFFMSSNEFGAADGESGDNSLSGRKVPYSIVVGVDTNSTEFEFSQYTQIDRAELRVPYCWINSWLAKELDLQAGDWCEMKYFEPETVDGQEIETQMHFMVAGVVPLTEPVKGYKRNQPASFSESPTAFNDPDLTPTVPGITDQDSISKWDVPFELEHDLILGQDDKYWEDHRLTPKVFTPYNYASSLEMFGSRFGQTTTLRVRASDVANEAELRSKIEEALLITRPAKGLVFMPLRESQLHAASGTTPFDALFLSLSFFVIVAALLLVALQLKLSVEKRAGQVGIQYALGLAPGRVRSLLMGEYLYVTVAGACLGVGLGIAYAAAMIAGLETWWIGAISTQFLQFSFRYASLVFGFVGGVLASSLTIYFGLRRLAKLAPLSLLRGQTDVLARNQHGPNRAAMASAGFCVFGAVGLSVAGFGQSGMARAGIFFGCGVLVLTAALLLLHQWIAQGTRLEQSQLMRQQNLLLLAWRAVSRNPFRSSLAIGLLGVASFLIASMSVFQISPNKLGYGGFDLIAESSQPIFKNISSSSVRTELLGEQARALAKTTIVSMRQRQGEDASCNNLFQASQPTILGVSDSLRSLTDLSPDANQFSWAAARTPQNPWASLQAVASGEEGSPIPVILDQNTAAWSLKQGGALETVFHLQYPGKQIYFRTVGLLSNSVLQGKLLISEANFQSLFPNISGYGFFLIRSGDPDSIDAEIQALEDGWSDEGMDVTRSDLILEKLLGVQNTYISAFQSLGALGLLLGTFGLVAVQLRSVVERRRELALMQAIGFSRSRISRMLTLETMLLLSSGMLVGVISAAISLAPFVLETGPSLNLLGPMVMLATVLVLGGIVSILAVGSATRQSILAGLRSE
ncbi:MAG: ABC transporter permease [Planctomycetales bacterium]|nr:ABC transporter permease [Planctomycetales bacterium]